MMTQSQIEYLERRVNDGREMALNGDVSQPNEYLEEYKVKSRSDPSQFYIVTHNGCDCPDYAKKGKSLPCKHYEAVRYFIFMMEMCA